MCESVWIYPCIGTFKCVMFALARVFVCMFMCIFVCLCACALCNCMYVREYLRVFACPQVYM